MIIIKKDKINIQMITFGIVAAILVIIIPIFLYICFITPSESGIIKPEDTGAWLNYYGAVLGGAITLVGVWLTIDYQEKEKKVDRAIEYKPIIDLVEISFVNGCVYRSVSLGIPGYGGYQYSNNYPDNISKINFGFTIINNGRGETSKAIIKSFTPYNFDWTYESELHSTTSCPQSLGEVLVNQKVGIIIELPLLLLVKKDIFDSRDVIYLDTLLTFEYSDMFDEITYEYQLNIRFKVKLDKKGAEYLGVGYRDLYAVNVAYILDQVLPERKVLS